MSITESAVTENLSDMTVIQAQRERAFFRRRERFAPRTPGTITPRRPINDPRPHEAYVADLIATFCPHEPRCEHFTRDSCPEGYAAANQAINARYVKRNARALGVG